MKLKTFTTFLLLLFASMLFANEVSSMVGTEIDVTSLNQGTYILRINNQ